MLVSFVPSLPIPWEPLRPPVAWPNPLLTRALTKMKSLRCVRSFSFSNTTPSLFWTRWDLMSWRTRGWRMGHIGLCSQDPGLSCPPSQVRPWLTAVMREGCPVLLRVPLSPQQHQPPTLHIHAQRELL